MKIPFFKILCVTALMSSSLAFSTELFSSAADASQIRKITKKRENSQKNAAVTTLLPSKIPGVEITATLKPGKTPDYPMSLNLSLALPEKSHACLGWLGFETIAPLKYLFRGRNYEGSPDVVNCVDIGEYETTAEVILKRTDIPRGETPWSKVPDPNQNLTKYDGYVILNLTIDGELSVYRVDSNYFQKSALVVKAK